LVKCPKCGSEVSTAVKTWNVSARGPQEGAPKLMGLFECPSCKARFRTMVEEKNEKEEETVSIKNMVERIKVIKGELMQTLKNLREKLKTLETERANLMLEIEKLKKAAESRVSALESEVNMLREEVKSLRELLGYTEEGEK
jgi:chromosome segregation ATPase